MSDKRPEFVLLEGIERGNRFFTTNTEGDVTKGANGEAWYRILGYAETVSEAQAKLYGRVSTEFPENTYFWETETIHGTFVMADDVSALNEAKNIPGIQVLYRYRRDLSGAVILIENGVPVSVSKP